ncbi:MAG: hypothetical protein AB8I08_05710 [Sandaracinaceae bacterium]
MEDKLQFDEVLESEIPAFAQDGKEGDRVSFVEGGVLIVRGGRASFARWADLLGVVEHQGKLHVLVPRRSPAPPWLVIDRTMVGGGDVPALRAVADRLREGGGGGGGYRDAITSRRQGLSKSALRETISAHQPVSGAMEVPSTVVLGRSYPGLGLAQAAIVVGSAGLGYVAAVGAIVALAIEHPGARGSFIEVPLQFLWLAGLLGGAMAARALGRWWRAKKDATLPRQRVLVLAPDGCVVGFTEGVQTLSWAEVGRFGLEPIEPNYDDGLTVFGPEGERLGSIATGFLDAPAGLVVAVANAYCEAASA